MESEMEMEKEMGMVKAGWTRVNKGKKVAWGWAR
jgi:hypothetical protein